MATTIMLDAGHGGYDLGASHQGRREKDDNLRLALAVGDILSRNGVNVLYTRTNDIYQNPNEKAAIANESGADYFISFHRNSSPNPNTYSGVETLIYNNDGIKERLANNINQALEDVGFNNLGISIRPNLAVLRRTNMPAVLVETGFINTDKDNQIFDSQFNQIAEGIADSILDTLVTPASNYYTVQTGLFRNYNNALNLQYQLEQFGYPSRIEYNNDLYSVQVGQFSTFAEAQETENRLQQQGFQTIVIYV